MLGALARALRLSAAETGHLFDLAGVAVPGPGAGERRGPSVLARAALARYPDDTVLRGLVDELLRSSGTFTALWAERPVEDRRVDRKAYDVAGIGRIVLDCDVLEVPDDDQTLIVYSAAPGSPDAEKLDLLRVVGLQRV